MTKYIKKPVQVDAWQFTKENYRKGAPNFITHAINKPVTLYSQYSGEKIFGEIQTLEGLMKVSEDDYIIRGIEGEFYPCKPNIFKKSYEKDPWA
ncbi:hypothetical protein ABFV99_13235 [Cytobacillus horneckiae]|uniref:hypothetical protein n=1 Tax=Cytobacillus horneckiae TaxID=549687 RepID=UPI0034CF28EF